MKSFLILMIMFVSTIGPSAVIALVGYATVKGISRNPSAAAKMLICMIVAFIFAEAIAVISLLTVFNMVK